MSPAKGLCVIVAIVACAPIPASHAAVQYTLTDLGTLGGGFSSASGINEQGQIVGMSWDAETRENAFLYEGSGPMQNLGRFNGWATHANQINGLGQIVGTAQYGVAPQPSINSAFIRNPGGSMQYLGTLGGASSSANDINDSGQIVGWADTSSGQWHAFVKNGSAPMYDLGGTYSRANAINNQGQIAGESAGHAVLWDGQGMIQDINPAGWQSGVATGINDSGQAIGTVYDGVRYFAFLRTSSGTTVLPSPSWGSSSVRPEAINNSGQFVGSAYAGQNFRAFVSDGLTITDLNTLIDPALGWSLRQGLDINNEGQIVGAGVVNYETHAFLLTPVPEPGTLSIAAIASILLLSRRRTSAKSSRSRQVED